MLEVHCVDRYTLTFWCARNVGHSGTAIASWKDLAVIAINGTRSRNRSLVHFTVGDVRSSLPYGSWVFMHGPEKKSVLQRLSAVAELNDGIKDVQQTTYIDNNGFDRTVEFEMIATWRTWALATSTWPRFASGLPTQLWRSPDCGGQQERSLTPCSVHLAIWPSSMPCAVLRRLNEANIAK